MMRTAIAVTRRDALEWVVVCGIAVNSVAEMKEFQTLVDAVTICLHGVVSTGTLSFHFQSIRAVRMYGLTVIITSSGDDDVRVNALIWRLRRLLEVPYSDMIRVRAWT